MPERRTREWQRPRASPRRWLPRIRETRISGPAARRRLLLRPTPARGRQSRRSSGGWDQRSFFTDLQDGQERFLRHFHAADGFHPFFSFFLFFEELALAGNVAAVTFGGDILLHRPDGLAGDHLVANRRLNGDLEHLPWDQLFHFFGQLL